MKHVRVKMNVQRTVTLLSADCALICFWIRWWCRFQHCIYVCVCMHYIDWIV